MSWLSAVLKMVVWVQKYGSVCAKWTCTISESKSSWVPLIPCLHWSQSFRTSPQSSPPQFAHDTEWPPANNKCHSRRCWAVTTLTTAQAILFSSAFTATCKFWRLWRMRSVRHSRASEMAVFLRGWPKNVDKSVVFWMVIFPLVCNRKTMMMKLKFWFGFGFTSFAAAGTEPLAVSGDKREKYWILGTKTWRQNVKWCFQSNHKNRFKQFLESQCCRDSGILASSDVRASWAYSSYWGICVPTSSHNSQPLSLIQRLWHRAISMGYTCIE